MDDELRLLVINRAPLHALKEQAVGAGMMTLLDDGLEKAAAGLTSLAEGGRVGSVERADDNGPDEAVGQSSGQAGGGWNALRLRDGADPRQRLWGGRRLVFRP